PDHQRLLSRLPAGLRQMLPLRGMGARNARLVFERLGISSVEQLEWAARNGVLAQVEGITPRTVERLINHLDQLRLGDAPRVLLADALEIGARLVSWMKDDPLVLRAEQTGSARRRKETVGDLDVLVATQQPRRVAARFVGFPGVKEVLLEGSSRASVILDSGLQADLRTVIVENWGAGLHYFTGSRAHNIQLRLRANRRDLSISEHGIYEQVLKGTKNSEANRRIARRMSAGTEEADVFHAVGLPFIAPELRNGDGEIEAADAGRLPLLVDDAHLVADHHLRASSAAMLSSLLQVLKLAPAPLAWVCWLRPLADVVDAAARARFRREARAVGERFGVHVFCGVECSVDVDGHAVIDDAVRADVDVVLADCSVPAGVELDEAAATKRLITLIESQRIDGLSRVLGRRLLVDDGVALDLHAVLLRCARRGVFVEVSGEPDRLDLDFRGCRIARDVGALLGITARADDIVGIDRRRFAVWQARRGWVTPASVLNTLDVGAVRRRFGRGGHTAIPDGDVDLAGPLTVTALPAAAVVVERDGLEVPLSAEMQARVQAFLMGGVDDELKKLLERRGGNALQTAFALLAG
ncbi:MAG TPA: hypothetical protein VGF99_18475, partial [Myxococcota bacterium]